MLPAITPQGAFLLIYFERKLIPFCYSLGAMNTPRTPSTFVLRFWRERSITGARWRGSIEHVAGGARAEFLRLEELLEFLNNFQIVLEDSSSAGFKNEGREVEEKD